MVPSDGFGSSSPWGVAVSAVRQFRRRDVLSDCLRLFTSALRISAELGEGDKPLDEETFGAPRCFVNGSARSFLRPRPKVRGGGADARRSPLPAAGDAREAAMTASRRQEHGGPDA